MVFNTTHRVSFTKWISINEIYILRQKTMDQCKSALRILMPQCTMKERFCKIHRVTKIHWFRAERSLTMTECTFRLLTCSVFHKNYIFIFFRSFLTIEEQAEKDCGGTRQAYKGSKVKPAGTHPSDVNKTPWKHMVMKWFITHLHIITYLYLMENK